MKINDRRLKALRGQAMRLRHELGLGARQGRYRPFHAANRCLDSFDHHLVFRVERDGADGLPVARMPAPARRVPLTGAFVDLVSGRQDLVIMPIVSCRRADVADAAVQVRVVIPMHELRRPVACGLQVSKATCREFGPVLGVVYS